MEEIAKEFLPLLRCLTTNKKDSPWLVNFYENQIKQPYETFIEKELFEDNKYARFYPYARSIDPLFILKSYFTHEKIEPYNSKEILGPLRRKISNDTKNDNFGWPAQKNQGNLIWKLQNDLSHAIAKYHVSLDVFVSDDADVTLREIIELQILFYMKNKIENYDEVNSDNQQIVQLKNWIDKEIGHRVPRKIELDMALIGIDEEKPKVNARANNKNAPDLWTYFFNGAGRLPIAVQLEFMVWLRIANNYKINIEYFAKQKWKLRDLYLNLPLASVRFFLDMAFVALFPYRLLRTLVNEITSSTFKIIGNLGSRLVPRSKGLKFPVLALFYGAQAAFYGFLLVNMGLPIFPNPISWIPQGFMYSVPVISAGYYLSVLSGGALYKLFSTVKPQRKQVDLQNFEWLPFKPHPTKHRPEPTLALYDFPRPLEFSKQYNDVNAYIPALPITTNVSAALPVSVAAPAA